MDVFIAIAVLATLALVVTSRRLLQIRRHRVLAGMATGGWFHVLIGVAIGPYGAHVVEVEQIPLMTPMVLLGLGWIGFMLGLQANRSVLAALPRVVYSGAMLDAVVSMVVFCGIAWFGVRWWLGDSATDAGMLSAVVVLGVVAVGWSVETRSIHVANTPGSQRLALYIRATGSLAAILAVLLLGVWSVVRVREDGGATQIDWDRSGLTLGCSVLLPVLVGVLARFTLSLAGSSRPEQLVAFLGIVVFAAGIAAQLAVSPILAAMLTGVIVANLPGWQTGVFQRFIVQAEHVVAAVFALLAGVLMDPILGAGGFVLIGVLVFARILVKPVILRTALAGEARGEDGEALPRVSALCLGPIRQHALGPALVVSVWLFRQDLVMRQVLAIAVITGVVCEVLVLWRGAARRSAIAEAEKESDGDATVVEGGGA